MRARPRPDLETRVGAARKRVGAGKTREEEKAGRRVLLRCQNQTARGGKIIGFRRPDLPHDGGRRPAFQRLFHGPERLFRARRMDEEEASRIDPMMGEARSIKRALFEPGEILADPDDGSPVSRRFQAGGERQRKTGRRGMITGARRDDFMQGAGLEAADEHAIEAGVAERNARPRRFARRQHSQVCGLDPGDLAAQKAQPFRTRAALSEGRRLRAADRRRLRLRA